MNSGIIKSLLLFYPHLPNALICHFYKSFQVQYNKTCTFNSLACLQFSHYEFVDSAVVPNIESFNEMEMKMK